MSRTIGTDLKASLAMVIPNEPIASSVLKLSRNQQVIWDRLNKLENRMMEQERA
jgi:hypothetical protein